MLYVFSSLNEKKENKVIAKKNYKKLALLITLLTLLVVCITIVIAFILLKHIYHYELKDTIRRCEKCIIECRKNIINLTVKQENNINNLDLINEIFSTILKAQVLSKKKDKVEKIYFGEKIEEDKIIRKELKQEIELIVENQEKEQCYNAIQFKLCEINYCLNQILENNNYKNEKQIISYICCTALEIKKAFSELEKSNKKDIEKLCNAVIKIYSNSNKIASIMNNFFSSHGFDLNQNMLKIKELIKEKDLKYCQLLVWENFRLCIINGRKFLSN